MILHGYEAEVAGWYADRLGMRVVPAHSAIGFVRDGQIAGGILLQMENDYTATVHIYSELPSLAPVARGAFQWMFSHAYRINAQARVKDKHMKRHLPRLGFRFEGRHKDWFGPGQDVLAYYMTAPQCKWINSHAIDTRRTRAA